MAYHISSRGEAAPCKAEPGNCPLGGNSEHYDTPEAANAAQEQRMADQVFAPVEPKKMKLSELNKQVKETDNAEVLNEGIERGSNRTFKNMLKNENLTAEQVIAINAKSEDEEVKRNALYHKSFPVSEMSDDEFARAARKEHSETRRTPHHLESNDLTDGQLDSYVARSSSRFSGRANITTALSNPDNKLSQHKIVEYGRRDRVNMDAALKSGKYPASEIKNADDNAVYWGNVDKETNPDNLKGYGEWVESKEKSDQSEYIGHRIARNPNAPTETMDSFGKKGIAPVDVYSNPNTSESTRAELKKNYPEVARSARIADLDRETGGIRKTITVSENTSRPYSGAPYSSTTVQLDKESIQKHNLSDSEVLDIMGSKGYNAGSSYDPKTGVFRGSVDSSG